MSEATKNVILHAVVVFVISFGGVLATATLGDASVSALTALVESAAATAVIAVAHYLAGLVPNANVLAARRAQRAAAKASR